MYTLRTRRWFFCLDFFRLAASPLVASSILFYVFLCVCAFALFRELWLVRLCHPFDWIKLQRKQHIHIEDRLSISHVHCTIWHRRFYPPRIDEHKIHKSSNWNYKLILYELSANNMIDFYYVQPNFSIWIHKINCKRNNNSVTVVLYHKDIQRKHLLWFVWCDCYFQNMRVFLILF